MRIAPVDVRAVLPLLDALTAELAAAGYAASETFGYSVEQLEAAEVHLVGAWVDDAVVGVGGIELGDDDTAELKRFYVRPEHRGTGAASALIAELTAYAAAHGTRVVRLETGDKQVDAVRFYGRHGFTVIDRFGPYVGSATSVCMERVLR